VSRVVDEVEGQPVYAPGWTLHCAVCMYVKTGPAAEAVTVIEGYAVCDDHVGRVAQGTRFAAIIRKDGRPVSPITGRRKSPFRAQGTSRPPVMETGEGSIASVAGGPFHARNGGHRGPSGDRLAPVHVTDYRWNR
jgi:hypothetical protein